MVKGKLNKTTHIRFKKPRLKRKNEKNLSLFHQKTKLIFTRLEYNTRPRVANISVPARKLSFEIKPRKI